MTKLEMAKKLYDLSDENGRIKLEDIAKIVFEIDSPQDVVDNFLKDADKLAETESLWNEVGKLSQEISSKQTELNNLTIEFDEKYERLKSITQELGMEKFINLP